MAKRKTDPADTLDSCVRCAIEQVSRAVTAFDGGCDKDSVANLAKLVGIIGDLRGMIVTQEQAAELALLLGLEIRN